jgi:hypothetical protein
MWRYILFYFILHTYFTILFEYLVFLWYSSIQQAFQHAWIWRLSEPLLLVRTWCSALHPHVNWTRFLKGNETPVAKYLSLSNIRHPRPFVGLCSICILWERSCISQSYTNALGYFPWPSSDVHFHRTWSRRHHWSFERRIGTVVG